MCVLSPERIVVGGGVVSRDGLLGLVQREVLSLMNGYLDSKVVRERISEYITTPALGGRAGVLGAIALAELA
jgi:fructokinase